MAKISWSPVLSLGVDAIDAEHKKLIDISNELLKAVKKQDLKGIALRFHEYTVIHFANEENYMERIKYPGLEKHKKEHADLKKAVKTYQDELFHQGDITEDEVHQFIKNWLVNHVINSDLNIKKYAPVK